MPHIAVNVNMLLYILIGHCVYETFALLPLKLRVKFEWSIIKHCKNI